MQAMKTNEICPKLYASSQASKIKGRKVVEEEKDEDVGDEEEEEEAALSILPLVKRPKRTKKKQDQGDVLN